MMNVQPAVRKETLRMAVGVAVLSVLMIAVFLALGLFDMTVLWGTLLGAGFAVLNFFLMALGVQSAAEQMNGVRLPPAEDEEADEDDEDDEDDAKEDVPAEKKQVDPEMAEKAAAGKREAKRIVQKSYYLRMALMAVVAVGAIKIPVFNPIPTLIAFLFPRVVISLQPLINKIWKEV